MRRAVSGSVWASALALNACRTVWMITSARSALIDFCRDTRLPALRVHQSPPPLDQVGDRGPLLWPIAPSRQNLAYGGERHPHGLDLATGLRPTEGRERLVQPLPDGRRHHARLGIEQLADKGIQQRDLLAE